LHDSQSTSTCTVVSNITEREIEYAMFNACTTVQEQETNERWSCFSLYSVSSSKRV